MTSSCDDVLSFLVKDCIYLLYYSLNIVFNYLALKSETFLEQWKKERIIPVVKSGDKTN